MTQGWKSIVIALAWLTVLVLTLVPFPAAQKAAAQSRPATPVGQEVPERWGFFFDSGGWHLGYQASDGRQAIREYVVQNETVHNWRKLVTSHYFNLNVTPKAFFQELTQSARQRCPGLKVSMIEETPDTIIFEWENDGCDEHPPQRQIRRISRGNPGVLSLAFAEKRPYADENRDLWLSILRNAVVLDSPSPAAQSGPTPAGRSLPASALGPRPPNESSEYLETLGSGIAIDSRDRVARFVITLKPTRRLPQWAYLEARFENPARASDPIVVGETWDARDDKVLIGTPPLKELKCWNYEVVVYVYQDQTKATLLGTHRQRIQSAVNLQKADFDKDLQAAMTGASCP